MWTWGADVYYRAARMKTHIRLDERTRDPVNELAAKEDRPVSAMANILVREALAYRMSGHKVQPACFVRVPSAKKGATK